MNYVCEHCGALVTDPNIEEIDSGTVLTCPKCDGETVVDLSRPDERKAWYKLGLWASRRPRWELKALSDINSVLCSSCAALGHARPECRGCTALMNQARLTVARWLNELE